MPNLSEIQTAGHFKLLAQADSGVGKTCLAATFPGPIEYLDFDMKADSAGSFLKSKGLIEQIKGINVEQFPASMVENPLDKLSKLISTKYIPQQKTGRMEFNTLVLDSITTFSSACLQYIVKSNPGIKRNDTRQGPQPGLQDYGILRREFQRLIPGLLTLPCNVVMLAHLAVEKDEATGQIFRHSMMDGSFAKELPIYFKEVWRLYRKDGKVWAQTQTDHMYNCRSQIAGLPAQLDITDGYSSIAKYL